MRRCLSIRLRLHRQCSVWEHPEKVGYRIQLVRLDEHGQALGQEVFAEGWLQGQERWGRPNDVLVMPDGALLVSDDMANVIYRISYEAED